MCVTGVYALTAGCSGAGSASGGIDILQVDQPDWYVWYHFALVATFLYLPVAPLLARRAADIRVVAALPLIAGTTLTVFGLFKGLEFLSEISPHFGRGSVAAFFAETMFPWGIGAAASAVTSLATGAVAKNTDSRPGTTTIGSIALVVSAGAAICTAGLMLFVWTTVGKSASLSASAAWILFVISLVALSAAPVSAFRLQRGVTRSASLRWLWLFAVLSATGAGLVFLVAERLTRVAEAGG